MAELHSKRPRIAKHLLELSVYVLRLLDSIESSANEVDTLFALALKNDPPESDVTLFLLILQVLRHTPDAVAAGLAEPDLHPYAIEHRLAKRTGPLNEYSPEEFVDAISHFAARWPVLKMDTESEQYLRLLLNACSRLFVDDFQLKLAQNIAWPMLEMHRQVQHRQHLHVRVYSGHSDYTRAGNNLRSRLIDWAHRMYHRTLRDSFRAEYVRLRIPPGAIRKYMRDKPTESRSSIGVLNYSLGMEHAHAIYNVAYENLPTEILQTEEAVDPLAVGLMAIKVLSAEILTTRQIDVERHFIRFRYELEQFLDTLGVQQAPAMLVQVSGAQFGVWKREETAVFSSIFETLVAWLVCIHRAGDIIPGLGRLLDSL